MTKSEVRDRRREAGERGTREADLARESATLHARGLSVDSLERAAYLGIGKCATVTARHAEGDEQARGHTPPPQGLSIRMRQPPSGA